MSGIFISYRHDSSAGHAQRLYQHLSRHFGKDQVGFDLQFPPGANYVEAIRQAVGSCDVLIAVIGPNWLKATDRDGYYRLDQADDWVRLEIKTALDRGILVIPFLVDGARMPEKIDLPDVLKPICERQAFDCNEADLGACVRRLIRDLERAQAAAPPTAPKTRGTEIPPGSARQLGTAAYLFAGHAIGAAAQFRRLDNVENLNHVVPAQASSAIPATGGLAASAAVNYRYDVDYPRSRTLMSLGRANSVATGQERNGRAETEVHAQVESVELLNQLRVDSVGVHFLSSLDEKSEASVVTPKGSRIEGLRLGDVAVGLELDEELLAYCGSTEQLAEFYRSQSSKYRQRNHWRFGAREESTGLALTRGLLKCSLIRGIQLSGPEKELQGIHVDGDSIVWRGFGKIVLGELLIDCVGPHVAMVRLAMGSGAEGVATFCEAHCSQRIRP